MKGFALPSYTLLYADQSSSPFLSRQVQPCNITPGVQTAIHCQDLPSSSIHVGFLLQCPVHNTVAEMQELYQQMLPSKIYHHKKTGCHTGSYLTCRLCSKAPETQAHVLAGCCTLAQTKYLSRHNAALQILFFELLMDLELVDSVPP